MVSFFGALSMHEILGQSYQRYNFGLCCLFSFPAFRNKDKCWWYFCFCFYYSLLFYFLTFFSFSSLQKRRHTGPSPKDKNQKEFFLSRLKSSLDLGEEGPVCPYYSFQRPQKKKKKKKKKKKGKNSLSLSLMILSAFSSSPRSISMTLFSCFGWKGRKFAIPVEILCKTKPWSPVFWEHIISPGVEVNLKQ